MSPLNATVEFPAVKSLQETLREQRSKRQANTIIPKAIPGYGGRLVAKYRSLTWKEQRAIATESEKVKDTATQELYIAADSLITACIGVEALAPASEQDQADAFNAEGHKLDLGLARYLGLDAPETPRQALLEIFPSEMLVIKHFNDLFEEQTGADEEIDEELVKNSEALSE